MDVEVVSLRLIDSKYGVDKKHQTIGFMTIRIGDITIQDCKAMWDSEDKRYWVAMPSSSYDTSLGKKYKNIVTIEKTAMNNITAALIPQIEDWIKINKTSADNSDGADAAKYEQASEYTPPDDDVPF